MTERGVDLLVTLFAVIIAALLVVQCRDTWRSTMAIIHAPSDPPAATPPPILDLSSIFRLAPFGHAEATGIGGDANATGLLLRGVVVGRPASASTALIAVAGKPAMAYAVGDVLPGGAKLDGVEFDLVVLRIGGQLQTLGFPVAAASGAAASDSAATGEASPAASFDNADRGAAQPRSLLEIFAASATPGGYRVGAALSDDLRHAGVQPGDIIEKVGGQTVGDPARDRALYDEAVVAGHVSVELIRGGKRIVASLPLH